jgi:hypothetical protein
MADVLHDNSIAVLFFPLDTLTVCAPTSKLYYGTANLEASCDISNSDGTSAAVLYSLATRGM